MTNKTQLLAETGQQNYTVVREFAAPREKVFKAFTDPSLYAQWFLPSECNMQIEKMDAVSGGSFLHSHTQPGAGQFQFYGVYHEVVAPELIVKTWEFRGLPFKVRPVLELARFESMDTNRTRVTIENICASTQERDGMISAGMEPTLNITHEQLDTLLQSL